MNKAQVSMGSINNKFQCLLGLVHPRIMYPLVSQYSFQIKTFRNIL
jgi:hypothetical protein